MGNELLVAAGAANLVLGTRLVPEGLEPLSRLAGGGDPGLESFSKPLALAFSPDGSLLAVGTGGDDALYLFSRSLEGSLSFQARIEASACAPFGPLSDPVALAFSPSGASLFVLSYYGKCLIRLDRDGAGAWLPAAALRSGLAGVSGFDYPKRLVLSPDGRRAFISGGGAADGIALVDCSFPGSLSFMASLLPDGSDAAPPRPAALALSPDGSLLAAASGEAARLVFHAISAER
jgi:hypothetical protein